MQTFDTIQPVDSVELFSLAHLVGIHEDAFTELAKLLYRHAKDEWAKEIKTERYLIKATVESIKRFNQTNPTRQGQHLIDMYSQFGSQDEFEFHPVLQIDFLSLMEDLDNAMMPENIKARFMALTFAAIRGSELENASDATEKAFAEFIAERTKTMAEVSARYFLMDISELFYQIGADPLLASLSDNRVSSDLWFSFTDRMQTEMTLEDRQRFQAKMAIIVAKRLGNDSIASKTYADIESTLGWETDADADVSNPLQYVDIMGAIRSWNYRACSGHPECAKNFLKFLDMAFDCIVHKNDFDKCDILSKALGEDQLFQIRKLAAEA